MKAFKWRLFLVVFNLGLALVLSTVGLREYESDHKSHPEYFYHGNLYYIPPAQIVMYCINTPAYTASAGFAEFGIRNLRSDNGLFTAYLFFYVYWGLLVATAAFWWWVGWQLDTRADRRYSPKAPAKIVKTTVYTLVALVSLVMAHGGYVLRRSDLVARPIATAKIAWGIGLFLYFVTMIWRQTRQQPRPG